MANITASGLAWFYFTNFPSYTDDAHPPTQFISHSLLMAHSISRLFHNFSGCIYRLIRRKIQLNLGLNQKMISVAIIQSIQQLGEHQIDTIGLQSSESNLSQQLVNCEPQCLYYWRIFANLRAFTCVMSFTINKDLRPLLLPHFLGHSSKWMLGKVAWSWPGTTVNELFHLTGQSP